MNFSKLFGKKDKGGDKAKSYNAEKKELILDEVIEDLELIIGNLDTKTSALQEEAKTKLREGDKAGAKRILVKKKKLFKQIKQSESTLAMMEEQKMMLESKSRIIDVFPAIKKKYQAVNEATKRISVEDLQQMKEDLDKVKAGQKELNDFFNDYEDQDQEGVDEELEQLEEDMAKEEAGAMSISNKENLGPILTEKNNEETDLNSFLAL